MKTLSLKLPDQLEKKLALAAEEARTSKSEVVRKALEAYLHGEGRPQKGSFLDLAADLIGSVEGPGDLSYNSEHLQGFCK